MTDPILPNELLLDQFIEQDIRVWVEEKQREPKQIDLFEGD